MKKKEIIPKDTSYVPLTQQPYCCVPTCIQMIMLRHNIPLHPAELIAKHLDVVVSPEKKRLFWNLPSTKKRPQVGWGTRINESLTLNKMFKRLKIPLRADFVLIDKFSNSTLLKEYLFDAEKSKKAVVLCYNYQSLFSEGNDGGHCCVFDHIDVDTGKIRFVDPGANVPKWRTVSVTKLYKAMQEHGAKNMGGCWIISYENS